MKKIYPYIDESGREIRLISSAIDHQNIGGKEFIVDEQITPTLTNWEVFMQATKGNWACYNFIKRREDFDGDFEHKLYYGKVDGLGYIVAEDEFINTSKKKLIRKNVFETNSSSTHSLVVPKKVKDENYELEDSLDHDYSFGREESRLVDSWDEKLAYIYMTIKELNEWSNADYKITKSMLKAFKKRVNKLYQEVYNLVEYKPYDYPQPNDIFAYIDGKKELKTNVIILGKSYGEPYIDHVGEFKYQKDLLNKIFNDDEFLKRLLFNKEAYITIGGDEYRGYNIKTIGFQYDYEEDYINHGTEECPQYEDVGEFWDKLREYKKENDVYLKGN